MATLPCLVCLCLLALCSLPCPLPCLPACGLLLLLVPCHLPCATCLPSLLPAHTTLHLHTSQMRATAFSALLSLSLLLPSFCHYCTSSLSCTWANICLPMGGLQGQFGFGVAVVPFSWVEWWWCGGVDSSHPSIHSNNLCLYL